MELNRAIASTTSWRDQVQQAATHAKAVVAEVTRPDGVFTPVDDASVAGAIASATAGAELVAAAAASDGARAWPLFAMVARAATDASAGVDALAAMDPADLIDCQNVRMQFNTLAQSLDLIVQLSA